MYRQLAVKTTNRFVANQIIDETQRDVYEYSFEVLFSDIAYGIVLVITALLFRCGLATVFFLAGFIPLRQLAGGYHASTYKKCHLVFWCNQMLMIACYYMVPEQFYQLGACVFSVLTCILVFALAPVANENKPLTEKEKKRFFILSRVAALIILAIPFAVALLPFLNSMQYIFTFTIGTVSVAVSLVAERSKQLLRERRNSNA